MAQIPSPKSKAWYCRSAVLGGIPAIGAFGLSFLLAIRLYGNDGDLGQAIGVIGFALLVAISGTWLALRQLNEEARKIALDEPPVLKAHLRSVHRELAELLGVDHQDFGKIRLALHKVIWSKDGRNPETLVQVTRYVGGRGGAHRRSFSVRCGIIGLTARTRDVHIAAREADSDIDSYRDSLVSQWGYTWDEAGERLGDRKAWFAAPVLDERGERVIGVVYADATDPEAFESDDVQDILWRGTQTLAEIIHEAYSSS